MELKIFVNQLFKEAKDVGFAECEVYYVDRESLSINVYKEEVEKYNLNTSYGLSFRGKMGDRIGYSYTEILDEEAIPTYDDRGMPIPDIARMKIAEDKRLLKRHNG